MRHEEIYAQRQAQIKAQRDVISQLQAQRMAAKTTLDTVERKIDLEQVRLQEIERSTAFVTGIITALNEAFDTEVEKKTQEGFELGWKAREKQVANPDKPLPKKMAVRAKRMEEK